MAKISDIALRLRIEDDGSVRVIHETAEAVRSLGSESDRATSRLASLSQGIIAANQAVELLGRAYRVARSAIESVVGAAEAQDRATRRLIATLATTGQYSEQYVAELAAQASALQRATTLGDEYITTIQRILVQFGAQRQQIEPLTRLVLDLASAYDVSAETMAEAIGGAIQGRLEPALRMLRIRVDEGATAQQKWLAILDAASRVQGLAAASADTLGGRIAQLRNAWGDLLESVGRVITQSEVLRSAISGQRDSLLALASAIDTYVAQHRDAIDATIAEVITRGEQVMQSAMRAIVAHRHEIAVLADTLRVLLVGAWTAVTGALQVVIPLLERVLDLLRSIGAIVPSAVVQQALAWGAVGAAAGSVVPVVGTTKGALVGAAVGAVTGAVQTALAPAREAQPPPPPSPPPQRPRPEIAPLPAHVGTDMLALRLGEGMPREIDAAARATRALTEATRSRTAAQDAETEATESYIAALRDVAVRDVQAAAAKSEIERAERQRLITLAGLSEAERIRIATAEMLARADVQRAQRAYERAREAGIEQEITRAREAGIASIERYIAASEAALRREREHYALLAEIGRVFPGAFAPDEIDLLRARVEQLDAQLALLPDRAAELRDAFRAIRADAIDIVDIVATAIPRATQAALSRDRGLRIGDVITGTIALSLSDITGELFRGAQGAIRASGITGVQRIAASIGVALTQSFSAAAISEALRGRVNLLPLAAGLVGAGALAGGTLGTITGASSLAQMLGISTTALGAIAGGAGLVLAAAQPLFELARPGTFGFRFRPAQTGLGVAGGALSGAVLGSIVPGIGTVIGAIVGGVIGGTASLFGARPRTLEDEQLRALERLFREARLDTRAMWRDIGGEIRIGARFADTVLSRATDRLLTIPDRGNLAGLIAAIERRPIAERRAVEAEAAVAGRVVGRAIGLPDVDALANTVINLTLALGRSGDEAAEMLRRLAAAAGVDFRSALVSVHDAFEAGAISAAQLPLELDAIARLFADELPAGLDVTAIAMRHMDEASRSLDLRGVIRELEALSAVGRDVAQSLADTARAIGMARIMRADDQIADAWAELGRRVATQFVDAALVQVLPDMERLSGNLFRALQSGGGEITSAVLSVISEIIRAFDAATAQLSEYASVIDMLLGPATAARLRADAEGIRRTIDAIELGQLTPSARRTEALARLERERAEFAAARVTGDTREISRAAGELSDAARLVLDLAQQYAPGSIIRMQLESQALSDLRSLEAALREQADAEEARFEALRDNTLALREVRDELRAQRLSSRAEQLEVRPVRRRPVRA